MGLFPGKEVGEDGGEVGMCGDFSRVVVLRDRGGDLDGASDVAGDGDAGDGEVTELGVSKAGVEGDGDEGVVAWVAFRCGKEELRGLALGEGGSGLIGGGKVGSEGRL